MISVFLKCAIWLVINDGKALQITVLIICFNRKRVRWCDVFNRWCLVIVASGGSVAVSQDGVDKALNENLTDPEENTILIEGSKEETVEEIRSSIEEPDESIRRQSVQVEQSSQNSGIVNE